MKSFQRRLKQLEQKQLKDDRYPVLFLYETSEEGFLLDTRQHEKILFDKKSDVESYMKEKNIALDGNFTNSRGSSVIIDDISIVETAHTDVYLNAKSYVNGKVRDPTEQERDKRRSVVRMLKQQGDSG